MRTLIIIALIMLCVGCDHGSYVDVGPVLADKTMLPEKVEAK